MSDYRTSEKIVFGPPKRQKKRTEIACDHAGTVKIYTVGDGYKCSRCGKGLDK